MSWINKKMNDYTKLTKDQINEMPLVKYEGKIQVLKSKDDIKDSIDYLMAQKVIGFDTETRPTFTKGSANAPSLVQLAGENAVFIYQLDDISILKKLSIILSNKKITKSGVSVDRDLIELMFLVPFDPCSFIDLGDVARDRGIPHHGLRGLAAMFLGSRISKGARTSDWGRDRLSRSQISYAATDAWIGLQLFKRFEKKKII
tara:strand:+ start:839 stop:1444 length:606 start_codon:yes stop_codon:yes gene_type:complete